MKVRGFLLKMKGIIYKATNTLNGRVYIGQTIGSLKHRKNEHMADAAGDTSNLFHTALYQYPGCFEWEVVETFNGDPEEVIHALNVAEEYHILKNRSMDARYGYNSTAGGYSSDKFADHIKERAVAIKGLSRPMLQYDADGNFIREFESLHAVAAHLGLDKVQRKVLSVGLHYGYQWRAKESGLYPHKIEPYMRPEKSVKAVLAYNSDGTFCKRFQSVADKKKELGDMKVRGQVGDICVKDGQQRAYYLFEDAENYPERININIIRKEKKESSTSSRFAGVRVACYSTDGVFLRTYESIKSAANDTRTSATHIRNAINAQLPFIIHPNHPARFFWRECGDDAPAEKLEVVDLRPEKVGVKVWKYTGDGKKVLVEKVVTKKRAMQYEKKLEHRVVQYTLDGEFVRVWDTARMAAEILGIAYSSIYKQISGMGIARGSEFLWSAYEDGCEAGYQKPIPSASRKMRGVVRVDRGGNVLERYESSKAAAVALGISQSHACNILAGKVRQPSFRLRWEK